MYKLSGHSLTKETWFIPETQPMILQERDSTCSITLGPEVPDIAFNDWLLDDEWPEGPHVWRVKNIDEDANTDTTTVELEHVIKALDDITLGEVTTADIGGSGATTCTAKQAVQYILDRTNDWTLGDFEYQVSNPYEFDGDTLYDALETVTDTLDNAVWEYTLNTYPFKLHIRQRDDTVRCEMRGGRNLSTLKRSISRSGMYTRIYPTGKDNLQIAGEYLSKNEALYGRVDHRDTDQSKSTEESLRAWAQGRLNRHCEPTVSITITGLELSQETGEALDNLQINKVCQAPLPEHATTITERIVKKQWRDRRKEPESVTLTLANNAKDISSIVKEQSRSGGKANKGQAKKNYLFVATGEQLLYEVFDECGHVHGMLRMTSESLRIAFENLNDCTRSEFRLTAESLRIQFENEINSTRSQIEMTSESLRVQFENELASTRSELQMTAESLRIAFKDDVSSLRSELQMTAQSLRISFLNEASSLWSELQMTASSLRVSFENEASSLRSAIEAEAGRIGLLVEGYGQDASVKRASIILAINNGKSSAHIDADEVYIGSEKSTTVISGKCVLSDVTADYISNKIATIATLNGIAASFSGNISTSSGVIAYQVYADGHNISNPVMDVQISGPTNNVYTLQKKAASDTSWKDAGTFSRAVASWTMGWSNGTFEATANPQNQSCSTTLVQGNATWDGNVATVPINAHDSDNPSYDYATGRSVLVDASSIYAKAVPDSGTASARHGSGWNWDFVITKHDGTTKTLTIDVSDIVVAARVGYTLGTFTLADVTLQGDSDAVYKEVSSGGVNYYEADSAATYYQSGTTYTYYTAGSGTKYDRGDSVTAREVLSDGGTIYYRPGSKITRYKKGSTYTYYAAGSTVTRYTRSNGIRLKHDGTARHYDVNGNLIGNHDWYHIVTTGETMYYETTSADVTKQGQELSVTVLGDSEEITPIGSTSVRLGSSKTYYKGDGGSFTPQGTAVEITARGNSVSVTPIKTSSRKMLASTTRYKAGTRYQSKYYTKS